uniref:Uncharacterized protein n=1 Tax=viral metagenome TaxID=1070528 RepID=A0A6C0I0L2_9ZZZZ
MDDFVISNLHESRNEWCSRLVTLFSPLVIEGIRSIFNESWNICVDSNDAGKYLMTFQNLLSRIPTWNDTTIEEERKRIIERSGCNYLEDLITCVHVIQLKVLTCIRVGNKQKKIDISIPKLDKFIHKVYIHVARKVYMNVYLFEKGITALATQKNNRELEIIVQECILTAIRESVPTEEIIRAYLDESVEQEEEVIIENIAEPELAATTGEKQDVKDSVSKKEGYNEVGEVIVPEVVPAVKNIDSEPAVTRLTFNDYDSVLNTENNEELVNAPKTIERLEEISAERAYQRKLEEEEEEMEDRIRISTDNIDLGELGIMDLDGNPLNSSSKNESIELDDIIEL